MGSVRLIDDCMLIIVMPDRFMFMFVALMPLA